MKRVMDWLFGSLAEDKADNPNNIYRSMVAMIGFLTIVISVLLLISLPCNKLPGGITFLIVAGASFAGGSTIGFLFGFPRAEKYRYDKKDDSDHKTKENSYSDNTNLEEVSDWLTKIIVGLTLIKLKTIISWIDLSAHSIAYTYSCESKGTGINFYVFGYCTIIFYFLAGAGLLYVWTRTNLSIIFTRSKYAQLVADKKELITQVQTIANKDLPVKEDTANDQAFFTEKTQPAIPSSQFKNDIETIYNSKKIKYKDDLQKGRWGGKAENNGMVLEGLFDAQGSKLLPGVYKLKLRVHSSKPDKEVKGEVAFFLHDTFPSEIEYTVATNNLAEINVFAWEAFVVGARLEDGTELELDLNTVKGFPEGFYWK